MAHATRLKNELSDSPLVSNVAFGFILMGLEKLVELEFECPCDPVWNGLFSSAFFIIPAVTALAIMMIVQGCRCEVSCRRSVSLSSVVPAVVWLILLFLDGQYFACAMTDWHGRYVIVDKAAPQKWCEPTQEERVSPRDLMLRSQRLFVESQVVAVAARDLKRAQEFARTHDIPRAHSSYDDLAKDQEIDVVYVGAIHPHHLPLGVLFMNAGKNVLSEKPLAMNLREVQELIATAKRNNVFLMEAVWTRFFPASLEISRLLSQSVVGEVKVVRADFGVRIMQTTRSVEKELGGGALIDIGIYCLQFVLMVYNGEKPECVQATGVCLDTGVDEGMIVTLKFSGNRMAVCTCTIAAELQNDAVITGTKGTIKIPAHMWCPTSLMVNGVETQYPVPDPALPLNFINSTGMRYEAEEVRQCLLKGLKESSRMSHADSALLAEVMDEARRQVGVVYSQDNQ